MEKHAIWGVLGGMGPVASAEFLKTIYDRHHAVREQDLPIVVLLSDPTFPDRTEDLQNGVKSALLDRLTDSLNKLISVGCSRVVICCMTIHTLLPLLHRNLQEAVVPMTEVLLREAARASGRYLMLCSEGSRQQRLYETHPLWNSAAHAIIFPNSGDQKRIHQAIYRIKSGCCGSLEFNLLRELKAKYDAGFMAGCSEIHVLLKRARETLDQWEFPYLDPFLVIADEIHNSAAPSTTRQPAAQVFGEEFSGRSVVI